MPGFDILWPQLSQVCDDVLLEALPDHVSIFAAPFYLSGKELISQGSHSETVRDGCMPSDGFALALLFLAGYISTKGDHGHQPLRLVHGLFERHVIDMTDQHLALLAAEAISQPPERALIVGWPAECEVVTH
ncbi:hypothetical protein CDAIGKPJ_01016 [Aeromonas salmonicida]